MAFDNFSDLLSIDGYNHTDFANKHLFLLNGTIAIGAAFNTEPVCIRDSLGYSVAISLPSTGSPSFTCKLQGCDDSEKDKMGDADTNLVNWFDVASGGERIVSGTITTSGGVFHLTDPHARYRWFRVAFGFTSGTGLFNVSAQGKG